MIYNVGPNQAYTDIQGAIDQAALDNPSGVLTENVVIRVLESGVYSPITLPDATFLADGTTTKVVIEAPNEVLARIEPTVAAAATGIHIGAGNAYVTIRGFTIQSFVNGISTGDNCHNCIVEKCSIANVSNAGIWFYQSDNCHALNNIVFQAKYGILTTLCKNFAAIYNSIAIPTTSDPTGACISISLQEDRGAQDYGTAVLYNNICATAVSVAVELHERDVFHLDSNNNNLHSLSGALIREFRILPSGAVGEALIETLSEWSITTGMDNASISESPIFLTVAGALAVIDLSLLANSPCIGVGANVGSSSTLPLFVDTALLGDDILYQTRTTTPTIGANEIAVDNSLLNLDLFNLGSIAENCSPTGGAANAAIAQYASSIEFWRPEVKSGYFFVRDRDFYLYANKGAYTLGNISRTEIKLPAQLLKETITVFVAGAQVTDKKYWEIAGTTFYLHHLDLPITSDNDGIVIDGEMRIWNDEVQGFLFQPVSVQRQLSEGKRTYWLPKNPVDSAPVVITDDTIQLLDPDAMLPHEFSTHYNSNLDQTEVRFSFGKNLLQNPQFDYGVDINETEISLEANGDNYIIVTNPMRRFQDDTDNTSDLGTDLTTTSNDMCNFRINEDFFARVTSGGQNFLHAGAEIPQDWQTTSDGRISLRQLIQWGDNRTVRPRMGRQMLVIDIPDTVSESQNIAQNIRIDDEDSYYLSMYAAAPSGSGSFWVRIEFLDHNASSVGLPTTLTQAVTTSNLGADDTGEYWQRFGLPIGAADSRSNIIVDDIIELQSTPLSIPATAYSMAISIGATEGTPIAIDCLMIEEESTPGLYRRVPRGADMTIEYEESDGGFYTVKDLTVSPFKNPKATGFLTIAAVAAGQFDTDAPINSTTLNDWCWPKGRLNHLPWARVYGKNKLHRSSWSRSKHASLTHSSPSWDEDIRGALTILTLPATVAAIQGTQEEGFAIEVLDSDNNPYAHNSIIVEAIETNAQFAGYISKKDYGLNLTLGQATSASLNEKGVMTLYYTPPTSDQVEYRGNKPVLQTWSTPNGNRSVGIVSTKYEVNFENHGNVTLQDGMGNYAELNDAVLQEAFIDPAIMPNGYTKYDMGDYISNGTLKVFAANSDGEFIKELVQSGSTVIGGNEYNLNLEGGFIVVGGSRSDQVKVQYRRRLAWKNPANPREIVIDSMALDSVSGDVVVCYDAALAIKITAEAPARTAGIPAVFKEITAIATNPHTKQTGHYINTTTVGTLNASATVVTVTVVI